MIYFLRQYFLWHVILSIGIVKKANCVRSEHFYKCEEEVEEINNSSVKWSAQHGNNEIVFSHPPCLDDQDKFIPRVCSNGSWVPLKNSLNQCKILVDTSLPSIYITRAVEFNEGCNIKLKIHNRSIDNQKTFWIPFKRQVKYGPYEIDYTSPLAYINIEDVPLNEEFLEKDCVVFDLNRNTFLPEDCSRKHHHICEYLQPKRNLCEMPNCTPGFNNNLSCYCKVINQNCSKYPNVNPFNKERLQRLANNDQCRVGNINSNIHGFENSYQIITRNKWAIGREPSNCSICLVSPKKIETQDVELLLSFEEESKELYLIVYYPETLLLFNEKEEESIQCFTNAAGGLSKRTKIKKVHSSVGSAETKIGTPFSAFEVELEKLLGEYWCQATVQMQTLVISPNILAYKKKKGHEYALRMKIERVCRNLHCRYEDGLLDYDRFITDDVKEVFDYLSPKYRVMKIYSFQEDLDFLIHISTGKRDRDVVREFRKLTNKLSKLQIDYIQILNFRSSEYCFPETDNNGLTWNLAELGESVLSEELCLDENRIPINRVCGGDFLEGAIWSPISTNCFEHLSSSLTQFLKENLNENVTLKLLNDIDLKITETKDIFPVDLYFLTKIFRNVSNDQKLIEKTITILDSLLNFNTNKFFEAQTLLNSSDIFLDEMEDILSNVSLSGFTFKMIKDNILVFITDPFQSNLSGIVLQVKNGVKEINPLEHNESFDPLTFDKDTILAIQVPETVLADLLSRNLTNPRIVVTVYMKNNLFVNDDRTSSGNIVSVKIPGYKSYLPNPLRIYFNPFEGDLSGPSVDPIDSNPNCAFWDYGKKTKRKKGSWSNIGSSYLGEIIKGDGERFYECSFTHLTHFALLVITEDIIFPIGGDGKKDDLALTIIASIGSIFSIGGIVGIVVTAVVFEDWRQRQGTKILLHISVAIFMEILLTEISEIDNLIDSSKGCIFFGVFLHYFVLSKFFWLLIYAFLQYFRFVKVFGSPPNNLVLKSVIVGWGLPLIPSLIVMIVDPDTYSMENIHFCYPTGYALYFGIVMPIFLVVAINIVIFCIVMYQVSSKKIESHGGDSNRLKQFQLAALLFFMLGLPYIFGLLSYLIQPYWLTKTFIYIFTICATIQGFILFLFYIVFNNETRRKWEKYLHQKF